MKIRDFFRLLLALGILPAADTLAAYPSYEIAFFDLPDNLAPETTPQPAPDLAALPGYPQDPARLTLAAVVFAPDPLIHGDGPYPTIIILHGSGGLWSNDHIGNGPASQFDDWAEVLNDRGYLCVLPDSFNPRGIPGNYAGKRPHHDPLLDDALCSPNYERPKDVVAALTYLKSRADVDTERIGMLAFSHGSQTGLNALMDASVDKAPYTVDYIDANNQTVALDVPSPVQIPDDLPFPKVFACYYPGCGHYGYHGQASSVAANRYMPDTRTRVIMFHGTLDSLLGVDDPDITPMTGNLFPIQFVESARAHADSLAIPCPFVAHHVFDQAAHSFDNETIESELNWNTPSEDADEKAKRLARDETLKWFAFRLKPPSPTIGPDEVDPELRLLLWHGESGVNYHVEDSGDLESWQNASETVAGSGSEMAFEIDPSEPGRRFYRVATAPVPVPDAEPENSGFFRDYGEFDY